MLKSIVSVIVGYLTMFVGVFVTFSAVFMVLGSDGAFKPGSFEPSVVWLMLSFVLGLAAAVGGGFVCALIARSTKPPTVLAILVLVLGLGMAAAQMMSGDDEPAERTGELSSSEAMMQARQPLWVSLFNPFIGAIGVKLGARLRKDDAA